jgi:O-acetyl-ADP-ribose deacetylase (regulator of RNase III)
MPIEFIDGDMFDINSDIMVCPVNCVGVMGAGIARTFKVRYPDMFRAYLEACIIGELKPGKLFVWNDQIICLPTKDHWRDNSTYDYVVSGLLELRDYLNRHGEVTVSLPALGCGNGNLNWDWVKPIIVEVLGDIKSSVKVFTPRGYRS